MVMTPFVQIFPNPPQKASSEMLQIVETIPSIAQCFTVVTGERVAKAAAVQVAVFAEKTKNS
ncbi:MULTISPECIES: hypothetical protein [Allofournierella]|uniref:Uncharacterized protein n=1 Tax=Allofournierella massiliensis TaxID=1650663 RepID=A0ABT7US43_9FIRM|nr:hypothetical protein [Fournierella massiliensis]MDM8201709.1 hypothetical protein [Fournierella massiliensis]